MICSSFLMRSSASNLNRRATSISEAAWFCRSCWIVTAFFKMRFSWTTFSCSDRREFKEVSRFTFSCFKVAISDAWDSTTFWRSCCGLDTSERQRLKLECTVKVERRDVRTHLPSFHWEHHGVHKRGDTRKPNFTGSISKQMKRTCWPTKCTTCPTSTEQRTLQLRPRRMILRRSLPRRRENTTTRTYHRESRKRSFVVGCDAQGDWHDWHYFQSHLPLKHPY